MSLIIRLAEEFSDTSLPKLYKDALINPGSMYLFDFLNSHTLNGAGATLHAGTVLKNLVDGAADAVTLGADITQAGAGLVFDATAAIDFGTTFDLYSSQHAFLAIVWGELDAGMTGAYGAIAGNAYNVNTQAWCINTFSDGNTLRLQGPGAAYSAARPSGVFQAAVAWNAGNYSFFVNGAVVAAGYAASTIPSMTTHEGLGGPSGSVMQTFSTAFRGKFYRAYKEDLTVSGHTSSAAIEDAIVTRVAADYAANAARFS